MTAFDLLPFGCGETDLREICTIENGGPTIVGAWGRDTGTMERRLKLALVYPSGEVSPIYEYAQSKLKKASTFMNLADLDGIQPDMIEGIHKTIMEKWDELNVQDDQNGKCSLVEAHKALSDYVQQYEEPGKVFMKDGYGHILSAYLQTVLDKLELGYTRLELQKNFKAWGLLRASNRASHAYSFAINIGGATNWFFSFKLKEEGEVAA